MLMIHNNTVVATITATMPVITKSDAKTKSDNTSVNNNIAKSEQPEQQESD